jgi:hypothetical protein
MMMILALITGCVTAVGSAAGSNDVDESREGFAFKIAAAAAAGCRRKAATRASGEMAVTVHQTHQQTVKNLVARWKET